MVNSSNNRAGQLAEKKDLINVDDVLGKYYDLKPDVNEETQKVVFGTSGHRGSSLTKSFNENHILAITQAICEYRKSHNIGGPLFIAFDTHCLSMPAYKSAIEVLVANNVKVFTDSRLSWTPTPSLSHAILKYNKNSDGSLRLSGSNAADGIVVTPSHNPPSDGGFKYNPPNGGPADTDVTNWIAARANEILSKNMEGVNRKPYTRAKDSELIKSYDFRANYVEDLQNIINMDLIQSSGLHIGADPLGGASVEYWEMISEYYKLNLDVVNDKVDPQWAFMHLDWDEKIRMDCSSVYAMAGLAQIMKTSNKYDIATGNDADSDRHGIVTKTGLMNPNHYLAVTINYLFNSENRGNWNSNISVGKTLVSSRIIDNVVAGNGRKLLEVPVGFKWFVDGLINGTIGFGGEESAGASFLKLDGSVWTTDKDGMILDLLASEIMSKTEKSPSDLYNELTEKYGTPYYERIDSAATLEQKAKLKSLKVDDVKSATLAGEQITNKLTKAPGNDAAIGGLKVETRDAWFTARPSGTENVYKIYAESFISEDNLHLVQKEAKKVVDESLK
ncbi:MAG: phosphoglucomutase (alpha-D-glucose-1,6-bisphosphate-dependent) [Bifidobacteriaceae bacterium]|jgi:phosphoglucomutase|nr:phosphoglucomutase (alpha-D-glucose-1,6-bisphosphate-dependent) [Bifidobacteriaceae bacterium]